LAADFEPKGRVARLYGVYREGDGTSERALFVIDQNGIIAWSYLSPVGVNLLYENQQNLEDESLFGLAAAGLSPDKLWRSLEAGIYRDRIDNDFRGGARSGVNGTPTFFINGEIALSTR